MTALVAFIVTVVGLVEDAVVVKDAVAVEVEDAIVVKDAVVFALADAVTV